MTQAIQFGTEGDDSIAVGSVFLTYVGLGGNDTYVLSAALGPTVLVEQAGGGIDTLIASVAGALTLPGCIENLILTGAAVDATGNALDNRIVGNANANTFFASGGNDTVAGGDGNDTYFVNSALDRIEEFAGPGAGDDDFVVTSVSSQTWPLCRVITRWPFGLALNRAMAPSIRSGEATWMPSGSRSRSCALFKPKSSIARFLTEAASTALATGGKAAS